ncbi:MAG: hypothetical protein RR623_10305 [Bacilli bacterium]
MIKKIEREIQKLEKEKQIKCEKRKQLDDEINVTNNQLKGLYTLKNQYEKLQVGAENLIKNLYNKNLHICAFLFPFV